MAFTARRTRSTRPGWPISSIRNDRLGNVVAVSNGDGQPAEFDVMDAFGNIIQTGDGSIGYYEQYSVTAQPYHLTTKEFDSDAGLYYFNARWYDGGTGRFVSRASEPTEREHPFSFAENNPLYFVDYDGNEHKKGECGFCRTVDRTAKSQRWLREVRAHGWNHALEELKKAVYQLQGITRYRQRRIEDTCSGIKCEDGTPPTLMRVFVFLTSLRSFQLEHEPEVMDRVLDFHGIEYDILQIMDTNEGWDISTFYFWRCC